jgi:hypothetical protein
LRRERPARQQVGQQADGTVRAQSVPAVPPASSGRTVSPSSSDVVSAPVGPHIDAESSDGGENVVERVETLPAGSVSQQEVRPGSTADEAEIVEPDAAESDPAAPDVDESHGAPVAADRDDRVSTAAGRPAGGSARPPVVRTRVRGRARRR